MRKNELLEFKTLDELENKLSEVFRLAIETRDKADETSHMLLLIKQAVQIMRIQQDATGKNQ